MQVGSAGVERYLRIPQLGSGEVLLTNGQRLASPEIGEHVMALTRALARGLDRAVAAQAKGVWLRSEIASSAPLVRLRGKTMLVVGLGGIGTEVARLASAAGMRVIATRSSRRSGPSFVDRVGLSEDLLDFAAEADVVANCLPLTPETEDIFDAEIFSAMRPTAFFINVGRGGTVDTDALIAALESGQIAGAGLDVTDPEPLPADHPLWKVQGVIITPHYAAWSDVGRERRWLLFRENLRRFVAGERLFSVVDPGTGILKHRVHPSCRCRSARIRRDGDRCDADVFTDLNPFEFSDGADPSTAAGSASASRASVQRQRQKTAHRNRDQWSVVPAINVLRVMMRWKLKTQYSKLKTCVEH